MTLIVSLRIPDGIVIAGDSLATMMNQVHLQGEIEVTCPNCGHQHVVTSQVDLPSMPATTFSYAQKVFPFLREYGVGTFGLGLISGKTIYFAVRELEKQLRASSDSLPSNSVLSVAQILGNHVVGLLKLQAEHDSVDTSQLPDNWRPLGFQVVGYDDGKPLTVEVLIGKDAQINAFESPGCTVSGQGNLAALFFQMYETNATDKPSWEVFSLQDAVAYAEFLINTTASHQKFSKTIPGVGGEIDIALVTPFDNFKWLRQKSVLGKTLGE